MKKILSTGILAMAVAILSQSQASAWVNFKAGVGANLGFQSGGNNLLWGAFRNGQPPAAVGGGHGHFVAPQAQIPAAPMPAPYITPAQTQSHRVYQTGNVRYVAPYGYGR